MDSSSKQSLEYALELAKDARLKSESDRGKRVWPYPTRAEIMSQFASLTQNLRLLIEIGNLSAAVKFLPESYLPCVRSSDELEAIYIYDLKLETHHRGGKILLRVCSDVCRLYGLSMVAEDERGAAVIVRMEHQPEEDLRLSQGLLQQGAILLLKEPYFLTTYPGHQFGLQVDHLSDMIHLAEDDRRIPFAWRPRNLELDNVAARLRGNEFFKKADFGNALQQYTQSIDKAKTPAHAQLAQINHALVYLRLGRHEEALNDAVTINSKLSPTEKGLFREATCLYKLEKFEQCLSKLQELQSLSPCNKEVDSEMQKVRSRLQECNYGAYDWLRMHEQSKNPPALVDCGTFTEKVEVRESPGKGRGLFTSCSVTAGQLLICEKAFAYTCYDAGDGVHKGRTFLVDADTMSSMPSTLVRTLAQIVQKLYYGPERAASFLNLDHGNYLAVQSGLQVDSRPVVDTFLASKILALNSFPAPASSLENMKQGLSGGSKGKVQPDKNCGVWCPASYINHSCAANCSRSFIGDMIIIRAAEDMPAGTELKLMYRPVGMAESFEQTQARFTIWNFSCNCYICGMKKKTSKTDVQLRITHYKSLTILLAKPGPVNMSRAQLLLRQVDKTYKNSGQQELKYALQVMYGNVARALLRQGNHGAGTPLLIRVLESGGFVLAPRSANGGQHPAVIEISKWGPYSPLAYGSIHDLWEICSQAGVGASAPELLARMRGYAQIAYSLMAGEQQTFRNFPKRL